MPSAPSTQPGLHVMAKPVGPICNLDCAYCYYLEKETLYPKGEHWRMSDATLEAFVQQYIDAQPAAAEISFAWQGGEPTLMPLSFFERIVELQKRYKRPGQKVANALQTNGVLLDEAWCEFLRDHQFLVGISIDGPAELHDCYRVDKQGHPTHERVERAIGLLAQFNVDFNTLVTVHSHNGDHGNRVYRYLRELGSRFIQFIPIVERLGSKAAPQNALPIVLSSTPLDTLVTERSVRPEQWGQFLVEVFECWIAEDVGRVFVQIFDEALAAWTGGEPSLCIFRRECGRALALEHNGDLYSCDHFVEPAYRLGNIHQLPIVELAESEQQHEFGRHKSASLPRYCRECSVRFACNGECPKNRFIRTPDGEGGLNYLCAGYKRFFTHIDPAMRAMANELRHGRPPANVMRQRQGNVVQSQPASRSGVPVKLTRNAPCPCGSGLKFKNCCLRRPANRA